MIEIMISWPLKYPKSGRAHAYSVINPFLHIPLRTNFYPTLASLFQSVE